MTPDTLRAAIDAALRRRDPAASVYVGDAPDGFRGHDASACVMHGYAASRGDSDDEALSRLAILVGLRVTDDGVTDPAEECDRLRGEIAGAAVSLGIISDDLDSTRRQLDAARIDLARVTAERDALRAAIRADVRCDESRRAETPSP